MTHFCRRFVTTSACLLCASGAHAQTRIAVNASGGDTTYSFTQTATGPLTADVTSDRLPFAEGRAFVAVDYGTIRVSATTFESVSLADPHVGQGAGASVGGDWQDTLQLSASGLPQNTPVTLLFTRPISGSVDTNSFLYSFAHAISHFSVNDGVTSAGLDYNAQTSATGPIVTNSGDSVVFTTQLDRLLSIAGSAVAEATTGGGSLGAFKTASADYSNTVHLYVQSLTPGVSIVSASGHNYDPFAAVPEPGSVALFVGISITGAGFLARRKKARKAA